MSTAVLPPLVVVPTYREIANLPELTARLWRALPDARLLLVDDASGDGTPEWVRVQPEFGTQLFLLERPSKLGLGSAYIAGFQWALDFHQREKIGAVVQLDADLSHDPAAIPQFLATLQGGADLVLGTRYGAGGGVSEWSLYRQVLSRGAARYVQFFTKMPFTDPTGGFKAFRPEVLAGLNLFAIESNGYSFQIEVTYLVWRAGWKITEVPILFEGRHNGRSKMSAQIVREAIWKVPQLAQRHSAKSKNSRP